MPLLERTAAQDRATRRRVLRFAHIACMCARMKMLSLSHLFLLAAGAGVLQVRRPSRRSDQRRFFAVFGVPGAAGGVSPLRIERM